MPSPKSTLSSSGRISSTPAALPDFSRVEPSFRPYLHRGRRGTCRGWVQQFGEVLLPPLHDGVLLRDGISLLVFKYLDCATTSAPLSLHSAPEHLVRRPVVA